jgi:hypothetical protein
MVFSTLIPATHASVACLETYYLPAPWTANKQCPKYQPVPPSHEQTFPDPVTEVLETILESIRSVNTRLLRFADILVQPPAP